MNKVQQWRLTMWGSDQHPRYVVASAMWTAFLEPDLFTCVGVYANIYVEWPPRPVMTSCCPATYWRNHSANRQSGLWTHLAHSSIRSPECTRENTARLFPEVTVQRTIHMNLANWSTFSCQIPRLIKWYHASIGYSFQVVLSDWDWFNLQTLQVLIEYSNWTLLSPKRLVTLSMVKWIDSPLHTQSLFQLCVSFWANPLFNWKLILCSKIVCNNRFLQ